jgi:hypothetical protein
MVLVEISLLLVIACALVLVMNLQQPMYMYADKKFTSIYPPLKDIQLAYVERYKAVSPSPFDCSKTVVPTPIRDLPLLSHYKRNPDGTTSSVRDEANIQANSAVMKPVTEYKRLTQILVRELIVNPSSSTSILNCLKNALVAWARAGALTGDMTNGKERQGFVEQMFFTINTTLAYLKIKQTLGSVPVVESWLSKMDKSVWDNFKDRTSNLKSWAVLSHVLVAIATDNVDAYNESVSHFKKQVDNINPDGTIASEMTRGSGSSAYIVYYADPLLTVQYILKVLGDPAYNQPKIHALVNLVLNIIDDPQYLVKRNLLSEPQRTQLQKIEFIILYDAIYGNTHIRPDNRKTYVDNVNRYKANLTYGYATNKGNLTSLFGI